MQATTPKFKRGHPTKEQQKRARRFQRRQQRVAELFKHRRYRKAQQSIYRVRTTRHREQRIALDMNRELRAAKRTRTLKTLHGARSDPDSGHY